MPGFALAIFLCISTAFGSTLGAALSGSARARLRFRLENLSNDITLTVRNHRSEELDFRNLRRTESALKIYQRIPFEARLPEIAAQLSRSARERHIGISGFHLTGKTSDSTPIPRAITIGEQQFRLRPGQIAESIDFRFVARADRARLVSWIRGWHDSIPRVMEPLSPIHALADGRWEVRGRAFRFRPLKFPRLRFAEARSLLPAWAQKNPSLFAREEPTLEAIVENAERAAPQARPLLKLKQSFMLRDARIGFFLLKAGATPSVQIN